MPAVFVHGVPEVAEIWDDLLAALDRDDVVVLGPPGFGCPRPDGFAATKDAYVDWLVGELETLGEPADVVGHDLGGAVTIRLLALRPDLLRSWASDAGSLFDSRYRWHRYARTWQTPEFGEQDIATQLDTPVDDRAVAYERWGLDPSGARRLASWLDPTMGACMLDFYRSAVDISAEWSPDVRPTHVPGIALLPVHDPFAHEDLVAAVARRLEVDVVTLSDVGHWWMMQDPRQGAATLTGFWSSLG